MFGLEKEEKEKFAFDLEKEIKTKPGHGKKFIDKAEERILEIKKLLREGTEGEQFEQLDLLLRGYGALKKTIQKIAK